MTDLPPDDHSIPSRLGVTLQLEGDELLAVLEAPPAICDRGIMPASALLYLADVVAGISVDTDHEYWTFTSDLSVRSPAQLVDRVEARAVIERAGNRSSLCDVPLSVDGRSWGTAFAGFARVPRRDTDPPKPVFDKRSAALHWPDIPVLTEPLRDAMGLDVRDPSEGAVAVELRPELLNPAGTLQGAMVSYVAEAAALELADHHLPTVDGRPWVVTDLDVRYLAQNRRSPIVSRARFVGPPSDRLVRVDLLDDGGAGRVTTAVVARFQPGPTATC